MRLLVTTLALACCAFAAAAADNPLTGSWKLNAAKSTGPTPPCVREGVLRIPREIFSGSADSKPGRESWSSATGSRSARCSSVFLFTPSADGRTLTMTRPNASPAFKTVFEKQ
jgi:hypothetical protein